MEVEDRIWSMVWLLSKTTNGVALKYPFLAYNDFYNWVDESSTASERSSTEQTGEVNLYNWAINTNEHTKITI